MNSTPAVESHEYVTQTAVSMEMYRMTLRVCPARLSLSKTSRPHQELLSCSLPFTEINNVSHESLVRTQGHTVLVIYASEMYLI